MSNRAQSLNARIRNVAKEKGLAAQTVMQNFMFERFLTRLALSEYRDKFILKGGMLIAAMVGLKFRATMDLDATIRGYSVEESHIREVLTAICAVPVDDDVAFNLTSVRPIRKDDAYGGLRASLLAQYDDIKTPLSIDITTGDAITPGAIRYRFHGMFDEAASIELWTYNIETILAEKAETILRRGVFNTRPRDYYDVYILTKAQKYERALFRNALRATAAHRDTADQIADVGQILSTIAASDDLKAHWKKYQREYAYAAGIDFDTLVHALRELLQPA